MITVRHGNARGLTNLPWLESRHTFSFDSYQDPDQMGFRTLRVINEDRVAGGHGFELHPHRDMEILSLVYSGALEHQDDLGYHGRIEEGEIQRITAGTGIRHAERNPNEDEVHFLQVWVLPERNGLTPGYEKGRFMGDVCRNGIWLIATRNVDQQGIITIHQDIDIYAGQLEKNRSLTWDASEKEHLWLQMTKGTITLGSHQLEAGDGVAVSREKCLQIEATGDADFLIFQMG